jgi:hypothetical protein
MSCPWVPRMANKTSVPAATLATQSQVKSHGRPARGAHAEDAERAEGFQQAAAVWALLEHYISPDEGHCAPSGANRAFVRRRTGRGRARRRRNPGRHPQEHHVQSLPTDPMPDLPFELPPGI